MVVVAFRFQCAQCEASHEIEHTPGRPAPYPKGWSKWDWTRSTLERSERVLCADCTERLILAVGEAGF